MTAAMLLAHRSALLTAIARVHADQGLAAEERSAIVSLLLGCAEDTEGDETLDALSDIFQEYEAKLPAAAVEAFAEVTNLAHILGEAAQRCR